MNDKIIRHAYINAIKEPILSEIDQDPNLLRFNLRGYPPEYFRNWYDYDCHRMKPDECVDGLVMIKPEDIPESFKVGCIVKVTIEFEEES